MNLAFLQDFGPIGVLVLGAAVCAGLDLRSAASRGRTPQLTRWVALATLILAFAASIGFWHSSKGAIPPDIEHGSFLIDRFALYFYAVTLAAAGAVLLCGADAERELDPHRGVFHFLLLMSCAGVLFTVSATDLVSLGVGLALAVLPMALAQGLNKTAAGAVRTAARALSLSGFSLVVFLSGAALLAALAGTTSLNLIPAGLGHLDPLLVLAAILLILGGAAQVGIFPFLWWRARLVERQPTLPYLAAILLGSLAATAALLRLLPGALGAVPTAWTLAAALVAGATLVLAPVLAWRQRTLTVTVVYLLLAQLALVPATLPEISQDGAAAILYLVLCVIPLAAGLLGLLGSITAQGEGTTTSDLRGLWARSPVQASALALLLAGLAGLPPLAGFFVRLMTVDAALHAGFGWLAWLELLSAVLSALVVFRWLLTILDARAEGPDLAPPQRTVVIGVVLCTGAVVSFGVLVGPLSAIALRGALAPLIGP
ncbi:MAG TPA: proton-conducting transporter membrane subunit [Candidatus Dormibacteraeota bacterium]|nr:proton-conducting transporter membrane subunit [Candidatus Dormibacteraeota bacterium]